jgi:putative LysE/RhtB family amino acid efflux pump
MNDVVLFSRAACLGLTMAAAPGPICLLCLNRSLSGGRAAGLRTALGAAVADLLWALAIGLGLAPVLVGWSGSPWFRIAGGGMLVYLGVRALLARRLAQPGAAGSGFWATLLLTLVNPMTLVCFAASLGVVRGENAPLTFAAGIFAGSLVWWVALSQAGAALGARCGTRWVPRLTRASGAVLAGVGLWAAAGIK